MELKSINMEHHYQIMITYHKVNDHKMKSSNEKCKIII